MRESLNDNRKEKNGEREREREMIFATTASQTNKSKIVATAKSKKT